MDYDIDAEVANAKLNECDTRLEEDGSDAYARGVKDALGWVLGHYGEPELT